MNNCGPAVTNHMQIPMRPLVLGLLLAFSAMAVRAQPKVPDAPLQAYPAATMQSTPIDLRLHPAARPPLAPVDMTLQSASAELQRVARWVTDSGDNGGLPYLLIDKVNAQVFAFSPAGQLKGTAPVLLGLARGDRLLAPNDAKMAQMPPQVRITPAGRFVSRLAIDSLREELLVLDFEASISLHPVVKGTPAERRAERLKSVTAQDNRVSYGCINVPAEFYTTVVSPAFTPTKGVVYVLPETVPAGEWFGFQPAGGAVPGAQQSPSALNAQSVQTAPVPDAR